MVTYQRKAVHTVEDIIAISDHAGSYFFTPDAMRFFSSRVLSGVHAVTGHDAVEGAVFYFVTSERFWDEPRHYTLRRIELGAQRDGRPAVDISTVDRFNTPAQAHAAGRAIVGGRNDYPTE